MGEEELRADTLMQNETYEAYVRHTGGRRLLFDLRETDRVISMIDPISPDIVGKLRVDVLHSVAPSWARATLGLVLSDKKATHTVPALTTPEEQAERRKEKGIAATPVRGVEAEVVRHLSRTCGLFERLVDAEPIYARAGTFLVEKGGGVSYRVVVDAREGNHMMKPDDHAFTLFSLETLTSVISSVSLAPTWFAVNVDFRHWFWQIPNHSEWARRHFVIPLERGEYYVPVAATMGWLLAPSIGQHATWSILLAGDGAGGSTLSAESGVDPEHLAAMGNAPSWLPLRGGGGVFVILDNVLVVTADRQIARWWRDRIAKQADRFRARLKLPDGQQTPSIITLTPQSGEFEFLGIAWRHGERYIKVDPMETMPGMCATGWGRSHRALASILGMLQWYHRGTGARRAGPDMLALRVLYKRATPKENRWNLPVALDVAETAELLRQWRERALCPAARYPRLLEVRNPSFAAVDASNTHLGIVVFDSDATGPTAPRAPEILKNDAMDASGRPVPIAVAELRAIYLGVVAAARAYPTSSLFVIATDSQNAQSWAERGYANNDRANRWLNTLYDLLESRRLYLIYIPTDDNVADTPSRNVRELEPPRCAATIRYLRRARVEALGIWKLEGGQVGAAERETS